ncbi:hypothetical protein ACFE04_031490 [Oxalis oulophora]
MGSLSVSSRSVKSDVYLNLGLKELRNGNPPILTLLSLLLEKSVEKNDNMLETDDTVTVFHGLRAPAISIQQYIERIFKYAGCSPSCFIIANVYLDRFLQQVDIRLTSLNVHRLIITSVMLAAKFIDDAFFNNAYYARVGGVTTTELNRMEMKFLFSLDFRLQVSVETFRSYCFELEKEGTEAFQIERPIQVCYVKESWSSKNDTTCVTTIAR